MKRYVEIEPVCPFLNGKPCIKDGWQFNVNTFHPCAFWDTDSVYNGISPDEPCRIKRAVNQILKKEVLNKADCAVDVPWTDKE